ncbi:iron uptake porin [Prochlorococcus sp. MIT 1011]|uniref:iron uptake porin n=1 Tax=Prochlorococcus sp. MIT 1011 TaxID=3082520 RepID=UPI0039B4ED40
MKLFQRLLVAPAALGLMAPMAANADITSVSNESEVIEARVDGVEAQLDEIQAGAFSSTTTMSGKAAFVTGYVDDDTETDSDKITFNYMYQLNMNSSFTGEDLLYTRIKTGNFDKGGRFADKGNGTYLSATKDGSADALKVDKIWYQFPVGDSLQVWVGPKIENYYMLASAPSIYKPITKQFALGGNASTYGSSTSPGFGAAYTQQVDDPSAGRFAVSVNYTGKGADDAKSGILDDDAKEMFLTKVEYGTPQWQVSAAFTSKTNGESYDGYYHTKAGETYSKDLTSIGLRAYWKPETSGSVPQVQVGYDVASVDDAAVGDPDEMSAWMVGLGWTDLFVDGNRAGVAFGSRQAATSYNGAGSDPAEDNTVWEAYYTFKVNDGVSITPAIFGGSDVEADGKDVNGAVVLTEFKF